MKYSENIDQLVTAMAMARQEIPAFPRNQNVTITTQAGQKYSFAYATLDSILDVVAPLLAKHGLVLFAGADYAQDGSMLVVTRLAHTSGQWAESAINVGRVGNLKEIGSAITYARRYQTQAILGVQADEDLDADPAQSTKAPKSRTSSASLRDQTPTPPPASPRANGKPTVTPGKGQPKDVPESQPGHPTRQQLTELFRLKTTHKVLDETLKLKLLQYGVEHTSDLSLEQYQAVCKWIEAPADDEQWDTLRERATAARLLPEGWARLREQGDYAAAEGHVRYMQEQLLKQA
mgnify:FL=1